MNLPFDDYILLSAVNTKLRDGYDNLDDFCAAEEVEKERLEGRLAALGYVYDAEKNAFTAK